MAGTTPRLALPYPVGGDTPDVPRDVKALADKLDIATALDSHGTLAARPAAGLAGRFYTDDATGVTYRDSGTAWAPLGDAPAVAALPATPADGQEVSLLVDATAGVVWRFKFRAGSASTYKWEFIGGPPLVASEDPIAAHPISTAIGTVAVSGYTSPIPREGDYMARLTGQISANAGSGTVLLTPVIALSNTAILFNLVQNLQSITTTATGTVVPYSLSWRFSGVVAGTTARGQVNGISGSGSALAGSAMIEILPIRVR